VNSSITQLNASSASQQISINALNAATSSYVTSAITASSVVDIVSTLANNQFTYTKGDGSQQTVTLNSSGGTSDLTSLNAFTASQETKNATLANVTASLNSATASLFTSASLSLTTASFSGNTLTFRKGDGTTFGVVIPDVSGSGGVPAGTISGSAQITALGFVSSSVTASSIITASVVNDDITFTKGDGSQFTIQVATGSFALSASYAETASIAINAKDIVVDVKNTTGLQINKGTVVRIIGATGDNPLIATASWENDSTSANTLGFVVTDIPNDGFGRVMTQGTLLEVNTDPVLGYTAGQLVYLSSSGQFTNIAPPAPFHEVRLGQVLRAQQNNGSIYVLIQNGYELSELHDVNISTGSLANNDLLAYNSTSQQWENKTLNEVGATTTSSFNEYTSSNDTKVNTLIAATGSYATTGSNVFTGDQTLVDAAGNTVTLTDASGSLVLVNRGSTSGSAGLSNITSSANQVNLLFKSSNVQSGSLLISGSGNILLSPASPTAGFIRYVNANNIFLTAGLPEITGSTTTPITISNNYGNAQIRWRGPVSSSTWAISNNNLNAAINIGSADATSANQAIAGGTITNNYILAAINYNAFTTPLSASANFTNNIAVGTTTLNATNSAIQANNNIFNGNQFTVNNSYFGTSATRAAQRLALSYNVFGGINSSGLTTSGSNTTAGNAREVIGNTTNGSGISLGAVLEGDSSHLYSTLIHGSNLTVTGSSFFNTYAQGGSAFIGRNNSVNGTAARSGETVFAVGTGTGTANRKTGFLIDSGSNTFVEGTLNVSGSTSFNGVVNITGSLTSSLTEGYVWVGGAGNITTLAATSSFGGGGGATFPFTGSAQITGSLGITGSLNGIVNTLSVVASTASIDMNAGNFFVLNLPTSSVTHISIANIKAGQTINLQVSQSSAATGSVTFSPIIKFAGGFDYTATAITGALDLVSFVSFDSNQILATSVKNLL
jgi:hypothetical protein